jgi:hypothetical protein
MRGHIIYRIPILFSVFLRLFCLQAQDSSATTHAVQMTVTVRLLGEQKRTPDLNQEDIIVRQGKDRLRVTGWAPVSPDRSPFDLFILIDDATRISVASQFGDLREFIRSLPKTTSIGVAYMRNGTARIEQNLTTQHWNAANALRTPFASPGIYGSPYLSVIDLMKHWPESQNRREILMITDGIDRFRGLPKWQGLSPMSRDVGAASDMAQRTGTIIHGIYTPGVGWRGTNYREVTNGQNAMAKLADETGGESFFLGIHEPVSFGPYLDRLQNDLENRYRVEFNAIAGGEPGLQPVKLTTEVAGVEIDSADSVWVEAR